MATHFFHSGMVGAPTNTNAAGSTLAIIRAVLSTGFNLLTPQTATVAGGVMTLTYSAPHGYEDKVLLRLDGAAGGSIVRRVTASAGSSSLTIPAPGFADGAVSGSLSTRVAPADWEEVFTGAGKAVFRSKAIGTGCTRFYYRVNDATSGSNTAEFRGFESMTDVDTGIGPFPTVAQVSGEGIELPRSDFSGAAVSWCAIADGRTVYLFLGYQSSGSARAWGDMTPYASYDVFSAFTIGASGGSGSYLAQGSMVHYVPRIAAGTGTAQTVTRLSLFGTSGTSHVYPSPIDGGMVFSRPILAVESGSGAIRGEMRGLMHCSSSPIPSGSRFLIMPSVPGVSGRVCFVRDDLTSTSLPYAVAFPIDEDWP